MFLHITSVSLIYLIVYRRKQEKYETKTKKKEIKLFSQNDGSMKKKLIYKLLHITVFTSCEH